MAAKKKTQKKSAARVRKVAMRKPAAKRKQPMKAEMHTDLVVAVHANKTHDKQAHKPIHLINSDGEGESQLPAKVGKKRQFSFPVALSQVRDRVETYKSKPLQEAVAIKRGKKQTAAPVHSPYLLDLKNRRTVVHRALQRTLARKPAAVEPSKQQGILSLFEEQTPPMMDTLRSKVGHFRDHMYPSKAINFVPRHELMRATFFGRLGQAFKYGVYQLGSPFVTWKHRRLQRALALPDSLTPASSGLPVVQITRAGNPIPVRHVSRWLSMRQFVAHPVRSLSSLTETSPLESVSDWFRSVEWVKAGASFAGICALIVLPMLGLSWIERLRSFQTEVLGATNLALNQLDSAKKQAGAMDFVSAAALFDNAGQSFQAASALLKNESPTAVKIITTIPGVHTPIDDADNLLQAGEKLSAAAKSMSQGIAVFTDENHFLKEQPLSYKIEFFFVRLKEAIPLLEDSQTLLATVNVDGLQSQQRDIIAELNQSLPVMVRQFRGLDEISGPLLTFLGHQTLQRHLVIFQNNTELRATGGFMGSLALIDMDRGEIKNIEIPGGGPYDFQGSLTKFYQAPRALQLINARWELQDANWFFDWPTSAKKISRLYDEAGGPSVDAVIAVDTSVLEKLLQVLGPVTLPAYGKEITADNFRQILQQQVEVDYDKTVNKPKKIIADLAPVLLERLKAMPVKDALKLAPVFADLLGDHSILLSHHDEEVMRVFSNVGWSGEVVQTDGDYVAVVHTNVGGGKTDSVIKDSFDMNVHVDERSEMTHTLTIKREHTGSKGAAFSGVRNVDYVRVYVPDGSTLVSAQGFTVPPRSLFEQPSADWLVDADLKASQSSYRVDPASSTEIYQESGKTVFANWIQVDPGQTVEVKFTYVTPVTIRLHELPQRDASWTDWLTGTTVKSDRIARLYHLYWQKQPGSWDPQVTFEMDYPQAWRVQSADDGSQQTAGRWTAQQDLQSDRAWGLLFF